MPLLFLMFALLLAFLMPALGGGEAHARVRVAATTGSLAALAAEVGGELVDVTVLSSPTEDPHYVDARPNLILTLNRAQLLVATGLELEVGWLPNLQKAARNAEIGAGGRGYFEAARALPRLAGVPVGRIDRAEGDIHPGGNPHFLADPRAGADVAIALGTRLAELDPDHAATYVLRAHALATRCRQLAAAETTRFAALPAEKRRLVTYHASWPYLLDWLGLEEVATVEPKPGIPPDPAHVASVLQRMRASRVTTLLQEEYFPRGTSEKLATLAGATLVVVPGSAHFPGTSYTDYVKQLAESLHAALLVENQTEMTR